MSLPVGNPARNFLLLSFGQMIGRVFMFVTTLILAHRLLTDAFGGIVFATNVLLYTAVIVDFGIDQLGPLEVSRRSFPIRKLAGSVVQLRFLMSLIALIAMSAFVAFTPIAMSTKSLIVLYGISLLANAFDLTWVFYGTQAMGATVLAEVVSQGVFALAVYKLVQEPKDIFLVPMLFLFSRFLSSSILLAAFVKRFGWPSIVVDRVVLKNVVPAAVPLFGSSCLGMVLNNFDLILLGLLLGTTATGLYGAAYRLVWVPTTVCIAYYTALRPLLAKGYINGFGSIEKLLNMSVRLTSAAGVAIVVGGFLWGEWAIKLAYGSEYVACTRSFQILLVAFFFLLISRNFRFTVLSFKFQSYDFAILLAAAALNVVLNFLLIGPLGMEGCALANVAAELLIFVLYAAATFKLIHKVPIAGNLLKSIVCGAVMAGAVALVRQLPELVQIPVGGLSFLGAAWMSGLITKDDVQKIFRPKPPHGGKPSTERLIEPPIQLPSEPPTPVSEKRTTPPLAHSIARPSEVETH